MPLDAYLNQKRSLCKVDIRLAAIKTDGDVFKFRQILLQVPSDIDVPILSEISETAERDDFRKPQYRLTKSHLRGCRRCTNRWSS